MNFQMRVPSAIGPYLVTFIDDVNGKFIPKNIYLPRCEIMVFIILQVVHI